jgi:hypothetical protein
MARKNMMARIGIPGRIRLTFTGLSLAAMVLPLACSSTDGPQPTAGATPFADNAGNDTSCQSVRFRLWGTSRYGGSPSDPRCMTLDELNKKYALQDWDAWTSAHAYVPSAEETAAMEKEGALYMKVTDRAVRHPNGRIELAPALEAKLEATKDSPFVERFQSMLEVGLYDPQVPGAVEQAKEYLNAVCGNDPLSQPASVDHLDTVHPLDTPTVGSAPPPAGNAPPPSAPVCNGQKVKCTGSGYTTVSYTGSQSFSEDICAVSDWAFNCPCNNCQYHILEIGGASPVSNTGATPSQGTAQTSGHAVFGPGCTNQNSVTITNMVARSNAYSTSTFTDDSYVVVSSSSNGNLIATGASPPQGNTNSINYSIGAAQSGATGTTANVGFTTGGSGPTTNGMISATSSTTFGSGVANGSFANSISFTTNLPMVIGFGNGGGQSVTYTVTGGSGQAAVTAGVYNGFFTYGGIARQQSGWTATVPCGTVAITVQGPNVGAPTVNQANPCANATWTW